MVHDFKIVLLESLQYANMIVRISLGFIHKGSSFLRYRSIFSFILIAAMVGAAIFYGFTNS